MKTYSFQFMISVSDEHAAKLPVDQDGLPRQGYTVADLAHEMVKVLLSTKDENISDVDIVEIEEEAVN